VQKAWSCNECGNIFKKSSELKKHVSQHRKKKSYQCPNCSESFNVEVDYLTTKLVGFSDHN